MLGVLTFVLVVLMLLWWLVDSTSAERPMRRWMAVAAKLVRLALIGSSSRLQQWRCSGLPSLSRCDIAPKIAPAHQLRRRYTLASACYILGRRRACNCGSLPPSLSLRGRVSVDDSGRMID
jgi:hypothetical protein